MILKSCIVPLDTIAFSDGWNLHPWELFSISPELTAALMRTGILHPPILRGSRDNALEIICGFKRLLFASSVLKVHSLNCLLLPEDTEPATILDIILADQSFSRSISFVEKARFIHLCHGYLSPQKIQDLFFDRLMLVKRPSTFCRLAEILQQHPLLVTEIHRGTLQERIVLELLRLPSPSDRVAVVQLFRKLHLGEGKQRMILPLLRDLALHQGISIMDLLECSSVKNILCHPGMNNPQKTQHLSLYLQNQLSPLLSTAETAFAQDVNTLHLPKNCTITHATSFEKDEVSLSITFKNLETCKEWIPTLKKSLV